MACFVSRSAAWKAGSAWSRNRSLAPSEIDTTSIDRPAVNSSPITAASNSIWVGTGVRPW